MTVPVSTLSGCITVINTGQIIVAAANALNAQRKKISTTTKMDLGQNMSKSRAAELLRGMADSDERALKQLAEMGATDQLENYGDIHSPSILRALAELVEECSKRDLGGGGLNDAYLRIEQLAEGTSDE